MRSFKFIVIILLSLLPAFQSKAQGGDTLSVFLANTWNHTVEQFWNQITVDIFLQNTGDSSVNAPNGFDFITTITNSGGIDTVDTDTAFTAGLFLASPGDTSSIVTLDWLINSLKYMPGNNITVIWPIASGSTFEVKDTLILNTFIDTTLGIINYTILDLKVYPNPAQEILMIDYKKINEIKSIEIFALNGERALTPKTGVLIDISNLSTGTYIVTLTTKDGSKSSARFVKN